MCTRDRLSLFTQENLHHFHPNVVLNDEAKQEALRLQGQFFSTLTGLISNHAGEQMLVIRKRRITYGEQRIGRTHLYLGIIDTDTKNVLSSSGEIFLPTSRYVDSPDSLSPIIRSTGSIPGNAFGRDFIWKFFERFDSGHVLDLIIGNGEVEDWFHRRAGTFPYMRSYLLGALDHLVHAEQYPSMQPA